MKIIVAGSNTRDVENICKENGVMKLYSLLNERTLIEKWNDDFLLIVDSGAHSWNKDTITKVGMKRGTALKPAKEFLDYYLGFIEKHKDKKVIWVEFDVYGHLPMSVIDDFYEAVVKMKIKGQFMRVYHPMIDGGDLSVLKKWISQGNKYIGVGNDSTNILDSIFAITKDEIKIHGFAMTKLNLMEKYPFFSVDSTSPLSTVIFGRYTRPIMGFNERDDIFKAKSIECYHDDWERIKLAVLETKKTEEYITQLWNKKGVIWEDLRF